MNETLGEIVIPDRPSFKAAEVCELLRLQPYVLRSWETEFKDLGVAKTPGAPRVYRRADVELALRIRQLVFAEGLTLAGVRRRLEHERPQSPGGDEEQEGSQAPAGEASPDFRDRLERAKASLRDVLRLLASGGDAPSRPATENSRHPSAEVAARGLDAGDLFALDAPQVEADARGVQEAAAVRRAPRRKKSDPAA